MKILICVENLLMDGVKRVATVLGNALASTEDVTYYSLASTPSFFELNAPLIMATHPVNTGKSFRGSVPLQVYTVQINDLVTTIDRGGYDIVIVTAGLLTSFTPVIKKRIPKVRVIAWLHNNYETYTTNYYRNMLVEFEAGLRAADCVVVLTSHDLERFSKIQPNTVKIYNPITVNPTAASDLKSHVISAVSRLDIAQKGLDLMVQAATQLPEDWEIHLAGAGQDREQLEALIQSRHASAKIKLLGSLSDRELLTHYRTSSVFIMTSRWEGLPLVIGEAMSFGLPVVSMTNTGAREYLKDGKFGILTPDHDVDAFTQRLQPLIASPQQRQYWATQSLKRAQSFSLSHIVGIWRTLFHELTAA